MTYKHDFLTVAEVVELLKTKTTHKEFRRACDEHLMNLHECVNVHIPDKLKQDVAGVLYKAIHGSTYNVVE
jgi:hypothetical protein